MTRLALAIQPKRTTTTIVSFLTRGELDALLAAPDRGTWHGRRDHALLVFAAKPGCVPPSSPGSPCTTSTLAPARTRTAAARAAKTAPRR